MLPSHRRRTLQRTTPRAPPASFPASGSTRDFSRCAAELRMTVKHFHIAAKAASKRS